MRKNIFSSKKTTDTLGILMVLLLTLEYILGMYTNLFIEIPKEAKPWKFAGSSGIIVSHVILGGLLAAIAIAILVLAVKAKKNTWVIFSVIGLVSILAALSYGSSFITAQTEIGSFIMAIGLGISLLAYSAGIYFSSK